MAARAEAAAWLAGQGVARGDRVMLVGENCAAMVVSLFACSLAGAWQVGVNARLSAREVASIRQHARPRLTLYTSGVSSAAREHAETAGATPAALPAWGGGVDASLASEPPAAETGELADAVATLIYTSGTTGTPKGVMVPHRGLLHFARISAASRRLTPHDIGYAALPLSHIFGIATVLLATQHAGASLVVRSRFDTEDVYRALRQPGISILQGVPTMFSRLLASAPPRGSCARRTCDISIPAAPRWTPRSSATRNAISDCPCITATASPNMPAPCSSPTWTARAATARPAPRWTASNGASAARTAPRRSLASAAPS